MTTTTTRRRMIETPWGVADSFERVAPGVTFYGTPSHGGFKLDSERNALIPSDARNADGWYEEDCEWSIVATCLPEGFTDSQKAAAEMILRNNDPETYARYYGVPLESLAGRSNAYDEAVFLARHAKDLIGTCAFGSWHELVPEGFVGVIARRGRDRKAPEEYRLVAAHRYEVRSRYGYVIQADDHPWSGPRS